MARVFLTDVCRQSLSPRRNSKTAKKISTAALVSLDYEISVPHIIRHSRVLI